MKISDIAFHKGILTKLFRRCIFIINTSVVCFYVFYYLYSFVNR